MAFSQQTKLSVGVPLFWHVDNCKQSVTREDITVADLLLVQFYKRVKNVFEVRFVTPNMHMHLHLSDFIHNFGPLHAFWLYSFERCNGLLGKQPTNNRSIELQLIRHFLMDLAGNNLPLAEHFRDIVCGHASQFHLVTASENDDTSLQLPTKYTLTVLGADEMNLLREAYAHLYPSKAGDILNEHVLVPSTCRKYTHVRYNCMPLSSTGNSKLGKVPYA